MNASRLRRRVESTDYSEAGRMSDVVGMPESTGLPFAIRVGSLSPCSPPMRSWTLPTGGAAEHRGRFVGIERPRFWCPEGTSENSPALQRWVRRQKVASPEGTAEVQSHTTSFSRPFGTRVQDHVFPGVKTPGYSHDVPPGQIECGALLFRRYRCHEVSRLATVQRQSIIQYSPSCTAANLTASP